MSQTLIDEYRPLRVASRPAECDERPGCWIDDPRGLDSGGGAPRCRVCGGVIRTPRVKPRRVRRGVR